MRQISPTHTLLACTSVPQVGTVVDLTAASNGTYYSFGDEMGHLMNRLSVRDKAQAAMKQELEQRPIQYFKVRQLHPVAALGCIS